MKIRELLTDESKWTKWKIAIDISGNIVLPDDPTAVCWCLSGAITKCYTEWFDRLRIKSIVQTAINDEYVTIFNDTHEFEDIKRLVDKLDI